MVDLIDLLRHGDIHPLRFGMNNADVARTWCAAEGEYRYKNVLVEKRGPFQVSYRDGNLFSFSWLLFTDEDSSYVKSHGLTYSDLGMKEFLDFCDQQLPYISWNICTDLTFDRQLTIRTCPACVVIFDLNRRELTQLIAGDLNLS